MNEKPVQASIRHKLEAAFTPIFLEIKDDSERHQGHAGHNGQGESHFIVTIVSDRFEGLSRLDRHRRVYEVLAEDMATRIHALRLMTQTKTEYTNK